MSSREFEENEVKDYFYKSLQFSSSMGKWRKWSIKTPWPFEKGRDNDGSYQNVIEMISNAFKNITFCHSLEMHFKFFSKCHWTLKTPTQLFCSHFVPLVKFYVNYSVKKTLWFPHLKILF